MSVRLNNRFVNRFHLNRISVNTLTILFLIFIALIGVATALLNQPLVILVAAFIPIVVLAFFRTVDYPGLMPVAIIVAAIFLPLYLPTGTQSVIVDSMVLTGAFTGIWVFKYILTKERMSFQWDRVTKWLFIFMATVPISLVWSNLLRDTTVIVRNSFIFVQIATTVVMLLLPASFIITANQVKSQTIIKIMVSLLLVAGGVGIFAEKYANKPDQFPIVNTGGLFTAWAVIAALAMVFFNKNISLFIKALLLIMAGGWIVYRFGENTSWLAGWLPTFIGSGVIIFQRSKKLAFAFAFLFILYIVFNSGYFNAVLNEETNVSGYTRTAAWALNLKVASKHFLFGTGPGGYIAYYWVYYPLDAMATHNNFLDIFSELGIVGFIPFLVFFALLLIRGYKLTQRLKGRSDFMAAAAHLTFAGTVASFLAMMIGDWVIPFPYTQGIYAFDFEVIGWVFMGLTLAIDRITLGETNTSTATEPV